MKCQCHLKSIISIDKYLRVFVEINSLGIFLPKIVVSSSIAISLPICNYSYIKAQDFKKNGKSLIRLPIRVALKCLSLKRDKNALNFVINSIESFENDIEVVYSFKFIQALQTNDIELLSKIPKSDLHNHVALGGSRKIIKELSKKIIPPLSIRFKSISEMNEWCESNVKQPNDYETRVRAAFMQARRDGIKIFTPSIAVFVNNNISTVDYFTGYIRSLIEEFSNDMKIYPELTLDREKYSNDLKDLVKKLLDTGFFYSIDLKGDENLGENKFREIYSMAKNYGLICKAHVGEFADAKHIIEAIQTLNLDCVQHGISAISDNHVMEYLLRNNIPLTICPSSNYYLSRVSSIAEHPIRELYRFGINVSICSDDIAIFDSSVSNEYLTLFNNKVLNEYELNEIRIYGLNFYNN